jgi:hypothetical protein
MSQQQHPPFTPAERLFRRLRSEWVFGGRVTADAIDLQGTSVDRDHLSTAEEAFARRREGETGLAAIEYQKAQQEFKHEDPKVAPFYTEVLPLPENGNPAHCEIRPRQRGKSYPVRKPGSSTLKARIKDALADNMEVVFAPPPPADDEF